MPDSNPWNRERPYDYGASWITSKRYEQIVNERLTGEVGIHWLHKAIQDHMRGSTTIDQRCLILGSNEGWMEIAIREGGFEGEIVASDIADQALARAAAAVRDRGLTRISHVKADLNEDTFDENSFDFVVVEGVLHHIERIDYCLDGLHRALRPNGLLLGTEHVAARRFQYAPEQVAWINAVLNAVPARYRPAIVDNAPNLPPQSEMTQRVYYIPPSEEEVMTMDPSEAISGYLLMDALRARFDVIERRDGGGALLMNMAGHFPFHETNTDPKCRQWMEAMAEIERVLYEQRIVPSDIVFVVCRSRK